MFEGIEGKPLPEVQEKTDLTFWNITWAIVTGLWIYSVTAAVFYFVIHYLL
jgi:hypothetical protein